MYMEDTIYQSCTQHTTSAKHDDTYIEHMKHPVHDIIQKQHNAIQYYSTVYIIYVYIYTCVYTKVVT